MAARDKKRPHDPIVSSRAQLERIADLLGCSADGLLDGSNELGGAAELQGIWVDMDDDEDRRRLLAFARQIADAR